MAKEMPPLTEQQKQLAADNMGLVGWFLNTYYNPSHYFRSKIHWADAKQECSIGLIKAACHYDESKGKFSSYAAVCMERELLTACRSQNQRLRIRRLPEIQILLGGYADEFPSYDRHAFEENENEVHLWTVIEQALLALPERHMAIVVEHYLNRKKLDTLARQYKVTRQRIQQITSQSIRRMQKRLQGVEL